jgi:hypothetical protein
MPSVGWGIGPSTAGGGVPALNGRVDSFGWKTPGISSGNTGFAAFGPTQPDMLPGNGIFDRSRPGFPGAPHVPTQEDILKEFRNGTRERPRTELPRVVEVPALAPVAVRRPLEARHAPAEHRDSLEMPSWVRWQWVVGILLLSLVIGTASGFFSRKQTAV